MAFISAAIGIIEAAIITTAHITGDIIITTDILLTATDTIGVTVVADIAIMVAATGTTAVVGARRCRRSDLTLFMSCA